MITALLTPPRHHALTRFYVKIKNRYWAAPYHVSIEWSDELDLIIDRIIAGELKAYGISPVLSLEDGRYIWNGGLKETCGLIDIVCDGEDKKVIPLADTQERLHNLKDHLEFLKDIELFKREYGPISS